MGERVDGCAGSAAAVHPGRRTCHDRCHRLPAGQCGRPAAPAPERPGLRLHAGRRDAVRAGRRAAARDPSRRGVLGARRRRHPLLGRQQPRRHEVPLHGHDALRSGPAHARPSSTTRNWPRASTFACRPSQARRNPLERSEFRCRRILLQTTIPEHPDDWDISRFSLLADELRAAGHDVIARNRAEPWRRRPGPEPARRARLRPAVADGGRRR